MSPVPHAEALPGRLPPEWFAPASMTGPGLGLCPSCAHQAHTDVCGYGSRGEAGVVVCGCEG